VTQRHDDKVPDDMRDAVRREEQGQAAQDEMDDYHAALDDGLADDPIAHQAYIEDMGGLS